ncbi:MAG TPA: MmgE/PrpD family protein [Ramlibacter sp.]|nr:MmgE/PrpD family protein [Ramlibacter sp.]
MLARAIARQASKELRPAFPAAARRLAADSITDFAGCLLAGSVQPAAAMLRTLAPLADAPSGLLDVPCPGWRGYTTAADAALYGGALSHMLDFDDVSHPAHAHPGTLMLPALFALAARTKASGSELVDAYLCGFELFGKLGRALNPAHYEYGWHPTPTLGPLAVALASACLLSLDQDKTAAALGIAASGAGGVRANFGTMTKPLHSGQASRAGLVAALLAAQGFTASSEALEHPFGYFACFSGGGAPDLDALLRSGDSPEILSPYGHALKPYPACAASHPAIEAAILLHGDLEGRAIRAVRISTAALTFKPMIYGQPADELQAKFSLPFCVAAGLVDGDVRIRTFSPARIRDPKLASLIERTTMVVDEEFRDSHEYATGVSVTTIDGQLLERRVPLAQGKPGRRFGEAEIARKFFDCAQEGGWPPAAAHALYDRLRAIDGDRPAAEVAQALMRPLT